MGEAERLVVTCPLTGRGCMKEFCGFFEPNNEVCAVRLLADALVMVANRASDIVEGLIRATKQPKGAKKA